MTFRNSLVIFRPIEWNSILRRVKFMLSQNSHYVWLTMIFSIVISVRVLSVTTDLIGHLKIYFLNM